MPDAAQLQPLHGIAWIRRDPLSALGLTLCAAGDAEPLAAADLPGHRLELHLFASDDRATGFAAGIAYAGVNSLVTARRGALVLVGRLSDPVERDAAQPLDEAVALVVHEGASPERLAEALRDEATRARARQSADARRAAIAARWRPVTDELARFPAGNPAKRNVFWDVAKADLDSATEHALRVEGAFDPDPVMQDGLAFPRYTVSAVLTQREDGRVVVRTGHILPITRECLPWRLEALRAACAAAGYEFDEAAMQPVRAVAPDELRAALAPLPRLWRVLLGIADEASTLHAVAAWAQERETASILAALEKGHALHQPAEGRPGRLETRRGGRTVAATHINTLVRRGLIETAAAPERPGLSRRSIAYALTAAGLLARRGDAEGLLALLPRERLRV